MKMKLRDILLSTLLISGILLTFSSCKEDEFGTVELKLQLLYDDTPFEATREYNYPGGYDLFFTKVSMFLSNIELQSVGENFELLPVTFIDFGATQNTAENAALGTSYTITDVPKGDYTGLKLNLGISSQENSTQPADYDSSNPLSNTGEYWAGWSSYIFHKTEGKMDTNGDGEFDTNIALHIGSDEAFRSGEVLGDLTVKGGEMNTITLTVDILDIYRKNGAPFDFVERPQVHHQGHLPQVLPLMDRIIEGFKVN